MQNTAGNFQITRFTLVQFTVLPAITKLYHCSSQDTVRIVQGIDGGAAKLAADMQKEVTDKRSIIDSLKTELAKAYDRYQPSFPAYFSQSYVK